jgi:hypothetical protein
MLHGIGDEATDNFIRYKNNYWRHGMSTSEPKSGERVRDVRVTDDSISVDLFDGRNNGPPGVVSSAATCYAAGAGELAHCWSRVRNSLAGPRRRSHHPGSLAGCSCSSWKGKGGIDKREPTSANRSSR